MVIVRHRNRQEHETMIVISKQLGFLLWTLSIYAMAENHCPKAYLNPVDEGENGVLQCKELPENRLQWIIARPQVRKSLTEYPQIKFEKGQTVTVSADGCVNVKTDVSKCTTDWKDYIDPKGNGIDRHYHGLIWIPGARMIQDGHLVAVPVGTVPVRIGSVAGTKK